SLLFIVLAAGLVPVASTVAQAQTTPPGSIGIRLLEAPVNRENDPRARIYIVDHISQGTTISRRIEVQNTTTSPQTIALYAGAASLKDGTFLTAAGQGGNDVARWTSVEPSQVTIPAGGAAQSTVTIAVPKQAADGERYGVVWAERVASSAPG